jgi:hypothetical protein
MTPFRLGVAVTSALVYRSLGRPEKGLPATEGEVMADCSFCGAPEGFGAAGPCPVHAAEALAGGVRSFLSSLPYTAPEAIDFQARVKLAGPLEEYESVQRANANA